jgi:hypothetical protein
MVIKLPFLFIYFYIVGVIKKSPTIDADGIYCEYIIAEPDKGKI